MAFPPRSGFLVPETRVDSGARSVHEGAPRNLLRTHSAGVAARCISLRTHSIFVAPHCNVLRTQCIDVAVHSNVVRTRCIDVGVHSKVLRTHSRHLATRSIVRAGRCNRLSVRSNLLRMPCIDLASPCNVLRARCDGCTPLLRTAAPGPGFCTGPRQSLACGRSLLRCPPDANRNRKPGKEVTETWSD